MALLRKHGRRLGLSEKSRPASEHEVAVIMKDVAADLAANGISIPFKGSANIGSYLRAYRSELSGAGIPQWITRNSGHLGTYRQFVEVYEGLQRFYHALDWFRVVPLAVHLLDANPDVRDEERASIAHLLVDEFQDLNRSDQELIHRLAGQPSGLCVVGDEDQSIYETQRFAHPTGLVDFAERVAGTTTLPLTNCHRCPPQVIGKANLLIQNNTTRIHDKAPLQAARLDAEGVVATFYQKSKKAEIDWLVAKMMELSGRGVSYREMMILFSDGGVAEDYIKALRDAGVPIDVRLRIVGPFDSECFAQIFAVLHLIADTSDNLAARQFLAARPGIGPETIRHLRRLATEHHESLWQAVANVGENPDSHRVIRHRRLVQDCYRALAACIGVNRFDQLLSSITDLIPGCRDDAGVRLLADYFARQAGKESVMTVSDVLENFEGEREAGTFEREPDELPDKVRVMTMHSAKGLEAQIVFIPAAEDDLIPGGNTNIEERRRLFYVSITRSKRSLLLSWASQRTGREIHRRGGRMLGKEKSRFLAEMGE
jgi:DNA helicase II / ATP-dependent DNA helicase PcrA